MKSHLSRVFIIVLVFYLLIGGVAYLGSRKKKEVYEAHTWKQTEATFKESSKYQETQTREDSKGRKYKETETYYKWIYTYQVDGKTYECSDSRHSSEKPGNESRTILVAEDDASVHLMYSSTEQVEESLRGNMRVILTLGGILLLMVGSLWIMQTIRFFAVTIKQRVKNHM